MQGLCQVRFPGGWVRLEMFQQVVEMLEGVARFHPNIQLFAVQKKPDGIARLHDHVADRSREAAGKLELRRPLARGVIHRGAAVDHQVHSEVGLVLVALDEVTVRPRKDPPVNVPGFIPDAVAFVVCKL